MYCKKIIFLFFFFQLSFSQEVKIAGNIKDNTKKNIENTSVVLLDTNEKTLAYTYSDEKGNYSLVLEKANNNTITIVVSSLGYTKKELKIDVVSKTNITQNFVLDDKIESLNEVFIESDQKIKTDRDITTIKVSRFGNKTEQTVEDILRKLPGIEVQKDGTIKAHGKTIDKLLVEGEDMFDKNYKLLSKNLDAKVLDAIQIIDGFEDNPILKKLTNSDKVALNLKLKKNKQNIWFGNVTAGAGVVFENHWKEGINLGLLRKNIKLFYLADYNNSGDKATDQVSNAIIENNTFVEDRYEKTAKIIFNINSNENTSFSKSQSVFNKAFFNSLSFTTKLKPTITLRGVGYLANDNQIQNSFSERQYNLGTSPILFSEKNNFDSQKTLASGEMELKYFVNEDNYLTNVFIYKNNSSKINDDLIFNSDKIVQSLKNKDQTFYNHFNHTYRLSNNKVLNNYVYFGQDNVNQKSNVLSPFLNQFLNANSNDLVSQKSDNSLSYFGLKSKVISKFRKLENTIALQYESNTEMLKNDFLVNNNPNSNFENKSKINQNIISAETAFRYNFSQKIDFTTSLNYTYNRFESNGKTNNVSVLNPKISLNFKKTDFGSFAFSYSENSNLPEINFLTNKNQLTDYRSFSKGIIFEKPLKNNTFSFLYNLFNDEKHFSISTSLFYLKSKTIFTTQNTITNDFSFENYILTNGGESYNGNFNVVNYFRKLKLATKLEISQNWNTTPANVNNSFTNLKSYNSSYKFSGTTYFSLPLNFDFGLAYNFAVSTFNNSTSQNITKDAFLNINYKITKTWLAELNSTYYILKNNYAFVNAVISYTPTESRFSYRLMLNNLTNENEFTLISLENYTSYKSSINLVTRYVLMTMKYRF
ncbi:TonB-dependent receptor [Flavobacterium psychrophilum]|uniref:TonB-dependent receptor n=1 Tax=Flavobacterium psychrophilum TaxID=96345 RepID=UPI000B7C51D3|nr:TonB-dependent receptor [Flavobacterium psychrophilum]EKT4498545.1 TonB-dependent receptor [Flavobacterium psychrophilum]EKT4552577.1 TonB-dependent receptor [Flavobacterium psychrophilum]ELM3649964.1 TonB-dependent receptor [Flavobacterium psychrophilum]ELM3670944.1 TonB-dependent receptor [Flavobacterium psychrophilum]ELM3725230.1 TonB-dependent receptor [Flavobacterium psychrophilum]